MTYLNKQGISIATDSPEVENAASVGAAGAGSRAETLLSVPGGGASSSLAAGASPNPAAAGTAEDNDEPGVADIQLEDDGFDSDVEIIRAQLFGVEMHKGCIALTQAIALCKAQKVDLGPQSLVKQEPEEKQDEGEEAHFTQGSSTVNRTRTRTWSSLRTLLLGERAPMDGGVLSGMPLRRKRTQLYASSRGLGQARLVQRSSLA